MDRINRHPPDHLTDVRTQTRSHGIPMIGSEYVARRKRPVSANQYAPPEQVAAVLRCERQRFLKPPNAPLLRGNVSPRCRDRLAAGDVIWPVRTAEGNETAASPMMRTHHCDDEARLRPIFCRKTQRRDKR
jgi:hypothetical protein